MNAPQDATLDALLTAFAEASHKLLTCSFSTERAQAARTARAKIHAHLAASAQTAAGEQDLDRARPTSKRIAAVEILSGMGYQWRDGTWAPWSPPVPAQQPAAPDDGEEMCPNCVTPWKCNGPHEFAPPLAEQPTDDELHAAWTDAINAESMPGSLATRHELAELRNRRTTWIGAKQISLRFALDAYLRGEQS